MSWTIKMYALCVLGSVGAMFYPALLKAFRDNTPIALEDAPAPKRYAIYIIAGVVIGAIVAALGFVAFLGDKANQDALKAAGAVSYFGAFTAGFASGSVAEEPLKKR